MSRNTSAKPSVVEYMTETRIGVIISSTRPTRIGPKVADWIVQHAPQGANVDIIDLADINLPFLGDSNAPKMTDYDQDSTKAWSATAENYDGFVIAVAEYNAGYTAPLKNAIDTLFAEWQGKPFGLVGYGWGGASRALNALQPVLENVSGVVVDGPRLHFPEELTIDGLITADTSVPILKAMWDDVLDRAAESEAAAA